MVYNSFPFIMTGLFHPYGITRFVLLKYSVLHSMLPDAGLVSPAFMSLMFA